MYAFINLDPDNNLSVILHIGFVCFLTLAVQWIIMAEDINQVLNPLLDQNTTHLNLI